MSYQGCSQDCGANIKEGRGYGLPWSGPSELGPQAQGIWMGTLFANGATPGGAKEVFPEQKDPREH